MKQFITEIILVPDHIKAPAIFSEGAIKIRVEDEAAGHFLAISDIDNKPLRLDFNEIDDLVAACRFLDRQNND